MSVTRGRGRQVAGDGERLIEFAVNERGSMIALYNGAQWCVIKIKSVAHRVDADWNYVLRSEVPL